ncbi:hypothetical protein BLNAU_4728 [Blattamonas nauphoetae]|uniref:Uncharacterized protein n=1 Tax=Blattamonas nauphoetae TaxID=2049346 RepID=A0ABQ9Y8U9_9EUKA|nr:hypothetical protein BLNAU_4728 [Blattamonas nauphoetae]
MEGKDEQYAFGHFLRFIDKGLQAVGVDRNSPWMREQHAKEHDRRAKIAEQEGDHVRAQAERERAAANRDGGIQNNGD